MNLYDSGNANLIPCVLVLDCSGSMKTEIAENYTRLDAMKDGIDLFKDELQLDPTIRNSIEIAVVDIGGKEMHSPTLIQDWVYARDFSTPNLECGGSTPLGEGLLMAISLCNEKKKAYKASGQTYNQPWIIAISDGEPTDEDSVWEIALKECQRAKDGKHALMIATGIDGCDLTKLNEFSHFPAEPLSSRRFNDFFLWLSSSLASSVNSYNGEAQFDSTKKFK